MARILINAVSAKHGGARTIVEQLVSAIKEFPQHDFVVLAGFAFEDAIPSNTAWYVRPKSGISAMLFSLFGVVIPFLRLHADVLLSFNNVNAILLPASRKITYFHQLKALDSRFSEAKVKVIRLYLRGAKEKIVVQSYEVKQMFEAMFGAENHHLVVAWPGIDVPKVQATVIRDKRTVIVPVSAPASPHKNFEFINDVASKLGDRWRIIVTAPSNSVPLKVVAPNIEFIGTISRSELFLHYRSATACLFGSTHETVGLPIFESLAVKTPVIAFDAPYARAFRDRFSISQGLTLAASSAGAAASIEAIANCPEPIVDSAQDFQKGDWAKIFVNI